MNYVICQCVHCGGNLEFDPEYEGLEIDCPHCQQKTRLGTEPPPASLDTLANLIPAPHEASDPSPNSALIDCPDCGHQVSKRAAACPRCGAPIAKPDPVPPSVAVPKPIPAVYVAPLKSRGVYIILGLFFGALGVHNFYVGRNAPGACQLIITVLTGWLIVPLLVTIVWSVIDVCTVTTDGQGRALA